MTRTWWILLAGLAACAGSDKDTADDTDTVDTDTVDTDPADDTDDTDDPAEDTDDDPVDDTDTLVPTDDDDGDGVPNGQDCRPGDPASYPGAPELCDGLDNDCDPATSDEGTISFHPAVGVPESLADRLTPGVGWDTGGFGPYFDVPSEGVVQVCGGTWSGEIRGPVGVAVEVVGWPGFTRPVFDGIAITLQGGGRIDGVTFMAGSPTLRSGAYEVEDVSFTDVLISVAKPAEVQFTDVTLTRSLVGMEAGTEATMLRGTATGRWFSQAIFGRLNDLAGVQRRIVSLTDVTVEDASVFDLDAEATVRGLTTRAVTADAGLGGVFSLDLDGWTHEGPPSPGVAYGGFTVAGDGSPAATATLRNVTGDFDQTYVTLRNLAQATLSDVTFAARGLSQYEVTDVAALDVTDAQFTGEWWLTLTTSALPAASASFSRVQLQAAARPSPLRRSLVALRGAVDAAFEEATFDGGGGIGCLEAAGAGLSVHASSFTGCVRDGAPMHGSALSLVGPTGGPALTVTDTTFNANGSEDAYAAVAVVSGSAVLERTSFTANLHDRSNPYTGALFAGTDTTVDLIDATFDGNVADTTGAMRVEGEVTMTGGSVLRHAARFADGAAIQVLGDGVFTFTSVDFGDDTTGNTPFDVKAETTGDPYDYGAPLAAPQICTATACAAAP